MDGLAAIRAEKAFQKLSRVERASLLAALSETKRHIDDERRNDRFIDRALHLRHRDAMKTHLTRILETISDNVGGFTAIDWLTDCHLGSVSAAMVELRAFHATAERLLKGAMAFDPDVGREGRGLPQLRAELTRQAFHELLEALEAVDVRIGATGGKRGGPGSRLLALLITHAVGFEVGVETVKALVRQRRRSK